MRSTPPASSRCPACWRAICRVAQMWSMTAATPTRFWPMRRNPPMASIPCRKWWNEMSDLTHLTMVEALSGLEKKSFSAKELAAAHNAKIAAHRDLNAFIVETPEKALAMAEASDQRRAKGETL